MITCSLPRISLFPTNIDLSCVYSGLSLQFSRPILLYLHIGQLREALFHQLSSDLSGYNDMDNANILQAIKQDILEVVKTIVHFVSGIKISG